MAYAAKSRLYLCGYIRENNMLMKKMLSIALAALLFVGCAGGDEPNPEMEKLKAEKEAVVKEAASKDSTINSFMESLNEIEDNLREVKQRQGNISESSKGNAELQGNAKDRINEDINYINELMEENKNKIGSLQSKLKKSNLKIAEFEKMIQRMTEQLAEKDKEIGTLKEQLAAMNIQITEMSTSIDNLRNESTGKTQVIEQQTQKMNTAYYCVGTYKELRDNRVVNKEGGFLGLGKKKILKSDFNQDYFTQIDVSKVMTIPINAKNAKVITTHPTSSYKIEMDGKKKAKSLTITNPDQFWKSSKYLVITVEK
jgi:predicted  nucleic acid-binding Zn-ribbon protein